MHNVSKKDLEALKDRSPTGSLHWIVAERLLRGLTMEALIAILDAIEEAQKKA